MRFIDRNSERRRKLRGVRKLGELAFLFIDRNSERRRKPCLNQLHISSCLFIDINSERRRKHEDCVLKLVR